ncbi:unnamed protein product [Pedinophyceae sp. YPF-701]|nr:unnamed protein product [Pedinophyceae sp. YPF-701]
MDLLGGEPGWEVAGGVEAAPEGSVLALALCSGGHLCAVVREAGDFQLRLWRADHTLVASGSLNAPRDGRRCSRWLGRLAECAPFAAVSRLHEPAWSARAGATRLLIALPSGLLPDNTPPEMSPAPGVADAVVAAAVAWPEPEKDPASAPRPGTIAGMLSQRARAKASGNTPSPGAGRSGPPELLCAVSAPHEAPGTILAGGAGGVLLAVSPSASGTALRNIAWRHRVLPRAEFRSIALPDVVRLEVVAARPRLVAGVSSNGSVAVWDTAGGGQLLCGVCEHDLCVLSIQLCHLRDDAALPAVGMVLTRPRTASAGGFGGGGAGGCFGSERQGVGGLEDPAAHRRRLSAYKVLVTEPDAAGRQMHFGVELPTRGVCSCAWGLGMGVFGFSSGHVVMWDVVSGEAVAAVEVPRRADQGDSGAHPRERVVQVGLRPGRRGGIEVMWRGSEGGGGTFVLSQTPVTRCPGEDSPGALCEVAGAGVAGRGEVGALA